MKIHLIGILVSVFLGLFVHPFSVGIADFLYKFLIFIGIIYLLYKNFQLNKSEITEEDNDLPLKIIPKEISNYGSNDWGLADLFHNDELIKQYISNQFNVCASFLIPDQGWIFYSNDNKIMQVYKQASFGEREIDHIPNQIEISGILQLLQNRNSILIEDNLQNAQHSLTYYINEDYSAASFIGIPIQIFESDKVYMVFDSATREQFNRQDIDVLENISSGIQITLRSRLKSLSLLSEIKHNEKLLEFSKKINTCNTNTTAIEYLAEFVSDEFEADRLTISTTNSDANIATIRKVIGQSDLYPDNTEFQIEEGLTGWVISKNKSYLIDDLEKGEYFIPRYSKTEKSNFGLRSFLGIPLSYNETVYGAITLEHHNQNKYLEFEKKYLNEIAEIFTFIFLRKKL